MATRYIIWGNEVNVRSAARTLAASGFHISEENGHKIVTVGERHINGFIQKWHKSNVEFLTPAQVENRLREPKALPPIRCNACPYLANGVGDLEDHIFKTHLPEPPMQATTPPGTPATGPALWTHNPMEPTIREMYAKGFTRSYIRLAIKQSIFSVNKVLNAIYEGENGAFVIREGYPLATRTIKNATVVEVGQPSQASTEQALMSLCEAALNLAAEIELFVQRLQQESISPDDLAEIRRILQVK